MKIKVFRFEVSNFTSTMSKKEVCERTYSLEVSERLATTEYIEDTINEFIKGKEVIDIKTDVIHTEYHNNGRSNTMHMIYTIMYK